MATVQTDLMPGMARWADARVLTEEGVEALTCVISHFPGHVVQFDPTPAASGPEVEVSVRGTSEAELRGLLEREGYDVLASRSRLGPWNEGDEDGEQTA